ncbi:alpha/beta-type small acid-soluble spore protein [Bacillus sp. Marseille-P3661]|uniref:alpha/beta-type small acid-soluble spore protein n=1 Tax=Bacillus sp. Marseille-P3661 TaxID=1936234 RepID=UPI000C81C605|nr:alpha/beta-type small acid-soluble spore protein [Bacillus sp. Marseille-P3661]
MGRNRKLLVPGARQQVNNLKDQVMQKQGFQGGQDLKYEVADELGIQLNKGYNGNIRANEAGKIGGKIGGNMVKEMIRMAEQQLAQNNKRG